MVGDPELLASLVDHTAGDVDPRKYFFRLFMTLRTTDHRYAEEINFAMWIGTGMWKGQKMIFE